MIATTTGVEVTAEGLYDSDNHWKSYQALSEQGRVNVARNREYILALNITCAHIINPSL